MSPLATTLRPGIPTTDLFTVPYMDGYVLLIPEAGVVAGVDQRIHKIVQAISSRESVEASDVTRQFLAVLERLGVFQPRQTRAQAALEPFRPTAVTFSLTTRCQLRCVYCNERAGDPRGVEITADIDEEIINAALNLVAENAVRAQKPKFTVSFQGEGEPTANWRLFEFTVTRAEQVAREHQLELALTISTNGMWSSSQRAFIAARFTNLSISMDGLAEIQNAQRPTASGGPSFPTVLENLTWLTAAGIRYGIRATVLPGGVESMVPFLDYAGAHLRCSGVTFVPVSPTGRAAGLAMPETDARNFYRHFVAEYHRAVARGAELGIDVAYSGCNCTRVSARGCGVAGPEPNFCISTRGNVSSCYDLIDPHSAKGNFTVYGRYDRINHRFIVDRDKLHRIRTFRAQELAHCRECFARWTCAGDCFARSDLGAGSSGDFVGNRESPRCEATRETTLRDLVNRGLAWHVRDEAAISEAPLTEDREILAMLRRIDGVAFAGGTSLPAPPGPK